MKHTLKNNHNYPLKQAPKTMILLVLYRAPHCKKNILKIIITIINLLKSFMVS